MICSDPSDFSPGSCARINAARVIDAYQMLLAWEGLAAAACSLAETPPP